MAFPVIENPLLKHIRTDLPGRFNEFDLLRKHRARILRVLQTDEILPPYEVLIHPSSVCNQQCEWCIGGRILEGEHRGTEDILKNLLSRPENIERVVAGIVDYHKDGFRVENVSFSGVTGEPLASKRSFMLAVKMLSEHNVRTGVFSNAGLIDEDLIETLLDMDYINVSLDAITPETFSALKYNYSSFGKTMFGRVMRNIEMLSKLKKERNRKLEINASFVLYPGNFQEIPEAANVLKSLGIKYLRVKQDISRRKLLSEEQKAEAKELIASARELEDDNFRILTVHRMDFPEDMERNFRTCAISDLIAAVGSDGNVYPCNYRCHTGSLFYGNAIEDSFKNIWEGDRRRRVKAGLIQSCPKNGDPFKNRSNRLLQVLEDMYEKYGNEAVEGFIKEIIDSVEEDVNV